MSRSSSAVAKPPRRLRDIHIVTDAGREPLTASIGLAEWAEPETPAELLAKADQALLAGKRGGKDQLRTASGEWPWEEPEPEVPNQPAQAG